MPTTLAVVGAGSVGATLAYAAMMRGAARNVVLYDINSAKVRAEAFDIAHGIQFMPMGSIVGTDDVEAVRGADIIAVTAGAKQQPGQSRMELAESTLSLMRKVIPQLVEVAPEATYMMVTNPVDVVTYAAQKISGLPDGQVFGSGTVLDSSRLRVALAERLGVAVQNVHAYIVGEHGDTEFPLWSSASVGGMPLLEYGEQHGILDAAERDEITDQVVNAAYTIIQGKGATNYAIALAATRIIESLIRDEHRVLPISTLLDGYKGIDDVVLSVPTIMGRTIGERLDLPMTDEELKLLTASADKIRSVARRFGF